MNDLLKKLRKYEIQIRKAVNNQMQGDFHSVFKGAGLEYDDVRPYQYGDDVRTIDWNVSAKGHGTFVKTFREDKEQQVYFYVDVSASQEIGFEGKQKADIAKEIAGILTLSAIKEGSKVGLIGYSDQRELYIKSGKGIKHAYYCIQQLFGLQPNSKKTKLASGIQYLLNILKRRSLVIFISDFVDDDFDHHLKALARKHDLIVVHLSDQLETELPKLGIVPLYDKEKGKTRWVNTSGAEFKKQFKNKSKNQTEEINDICKRNQADYLHIDTQENYIPKLIKLFSIRKRVKKRS